MVHVGYGLLTPHISVTRLTKPTNMDTIPKRTNPALQEDSHYRAASSSEFKKRLAQYVRRHNARDEDIKQENFASWEDLEDYVRYRDKAEEVSFSERDIGPLRRAANSRNRPATSNGQKPRRTNGSTPSQFSDLVQPGLHLGPPRRVIHSKPLRSEISADTPKFRRQRAGIGKCTGNKLKQVKRAYLNAYCLCESALQEVRAIQRSGADAQVLWHASTRHRSASLGYWFGENYENRQMNRMLTKIEAILAQWSLSFCSGFRGLLPVFIRCKSYNSVLGDHINARHIAANTIELMPRFFDQSQDGRTVIMLHEMGHRSTALLKPRDERHSLCDGGWNRSSNMCYRAREQVDAAGRRFVSGNPRTLAEAATGGNVSARKAALNNIDNYVCYMWNRERDHGLNLLDILEPLEKPTQKPANSTKPGN